MDCVEVQGGLFANCQEWHLHVTDRTDNSLPSYKRVDLLNFKYSSFRMRNVEI